MEQNNYAILEGDIMGNIHVKFGPVFQEMLFKEKVKGMTDDGRRPITIPSAQVS